MLNVITGEKIQRICDIYLGFQCDFDWNPAISVEKHKHLDINSITSSYDNPKYIFCYTVRIDDLFDKLCFFKNEFILVTHNSDYTITDKDICIINHPKIIHWFSQNVNVCHPKLTNLPIGIANSQWQHGNLDNWKYVNRNFHKSGIYFYFNIDTNIDKRLECKNTLENKGLKWNIARNHLDYLNTLSAHKYAICPDGNGIDSHRIWECLYLNVIPICIRSTFTEIISRDYPIILLNSWDELDIQSISNPLINFSDELCLKLSMDYIYMTIMYER